MVVWNLRSVLMFQLGLALKIALLIPSLNAEGGSGGPTTVLKNHVNIEDSSGIDNGHHKPLLKTDDVGNMNQGSSAPRPLRVVNQHGLPGIDISGFAFPSGFSFGGTMGSIVQPDYNELTVSFAPPHHQSSSRQDEMETHQQFDTLSIDDANTLDNEQDLMHHTMLHFGTDNNTVVTSQTGSTALLPCVVNNIGEGMVSWIRRKDYHLLTVGLTTYNSDERFQAIHLQHSEDWTLQIKFVQQRDAGLYECQVSSHPPQSIFVQLDVVEARAEISGPSEKFLKPGSSLRLQCSVVQSTEPPTYVFWYHNNRMINYDVDRGINVTTVLAVKMSTLSIASASTKHTGNYTCMPSNSQPASTYVHILNGENPAAMQHGGRGLSWLRSPSTWLLIFSVLLSVIMTISS